MHLSSASRPTRVRRLLAVSAAAVAVMIGPTACDYGTYGTSGTSGGGSSSSGDTDNMGDMPGMDHGRGQPVVVPVGNTVRTTPEADADGAAATAAATAERRRGRDGRDGRGRGYDRPSTTIPAPTSPATTVATETAAPTGTTAPTAPGTAPATVPPTAPATVPPGPPVPLGRDCGASKLPAHTGFQSADAQCVSTEMGEVAAENELPSLLITNSPRRVGVGQPFKLVISTRNLIRDRFLGAAAGGYYLESSFLDGKTGLQRGHFHTACRMLPTTSQAPDSSPTPAFFLATQDNGGGAAPDSVTIDVPATATAKPGILQCTSWAGDGSHRTPMMSRANQTPAMDSVRIFVSGQGRAEQENVSATDAQVDAAKQAQAQSQEATAQKPDQNGAPQPLPNQGVDAKGGAAPVTEGSATDSVVPTTAATPPTTPPTN